MYYPTSIGVSWLAFIAWEIYEWTAVLTGSDNGIETSLFDMARDLWINSLGALAICFIHDEVMKEGQPDQKRGSVRTKQSIIDD